MENSPLLSSFVSVKGYFPPFMHDAVMRGVHIFECMTKKIQQILNTHCTFYISREANMYVVVRS
ncbi:MAG: hypothetical protein MW690_001151 [Methanophagales archaeon]|nr:hypothetical protein [Methanophagales archaeon]